MNRNHNRIILLVLSFFLVNVAFSQTLYWIGGSGNFNDPKHWSLQSGGIPAFLTPNKSTDVVFDDNSGVGYYSINFDVNNAVRNLNATSIKNMVSFSGSKTGVVYISEGINLSPFVKFNSHCEMIFNSMSPQTHLIEFGINDLNCNLYFNSGNYKFRPVKLSDENTINFGEGNYTFDQTFLQAGNFISSKSNARFDFSKAYFKVSNYFKINTQTSVTSDKLHLVANKNSAQKFEVPNQIISQQTNTFVSFMTICSMTISTKPACSGPCSGILRIDFSGACVDPPYNVFVNNPTCPATAGTLSANNVSLPTYSATGACTCAINYQVVVIDNLGFTFLQNVNFIPNPASVNAINTLPLCSNTCDGKMVGNIFGSAPFTVAISPATVTPSFTTAFTYTLNNLCAGIYTFNVTDNDGCTSVHTKTLTGPPPVLANAITTSVTCNAACNGSIQISPTGGTAGYTVQFSTGPTFTVPAAGTASIINLCPGAYSSTITDSQGCALVTNTTVNQPPALTVTPTQTNLTCFANCIGAASVAVSGGQPPYFYVWSPATGTNAGVTNLCAGTQTVSILDFNLCPRTQTFNITSPPAITLTLSKRDVTCNSLCNGSATAIAVGGTGVKSYTWTGPAFGPVTNSVISALCPGIYTLNGTDALGCTFTGTVSITQPPAATITANVTNNTCFSSCAGSATAIIAGGNGAPFGFTWTPGVTIPQGQGTATLNSLCQGSYTLSATDASACPISTVITITQPASVTPNITSNSITCNGACNGSINAAPAGGNGGPFTFTLVTPLASTLVAAPPYINLCAGIYTLSIRDASACVATQTINITQPNPLVPSIASASISCFNVCNGSLAGSVLGGTPGYTLMWNTPTGTVAGGNLVNRCAGNYTFFVTDANTCTASATFSLTQPADITTVFNVTNPTCNGGCNGSIGTIVSGGTPGYTLTWSNAGGNPNINLCSGVYTLIVVDSKGCNKSFTSSVTAPPSITLAVNTTSTNCAGQCNGSATAAAVGGSGTFTYQFNTLPFPTTNTTGIISGLCAGPYIVSVTDANGCSTALPFNISSPPLLTAAISGILPTCNVCTGASTVTVAGGTPGYTVNWTNTVAVVVATGTNAINLCLGNYTANVIDSKGCITTASVNIPNTVSVTVITGGSPILCFAACNASATANAIGGTAPYTYTWNSAPTQTTASATNLCAGDYTVTVVDALGCSNTGSISIAQPSSITVNSTQTNIPCFAVCNGAITTTVSGGTSPYTYSWSPGGQTTTSLTGLCIGTYTLRVTDLNGCVQTRTFGIAQNPSITAVFTATNPSSCILNNGIIEAVVSGGSGAGYTFTWSPATASVVNSNTTTATGLSAGSYFLFITDGAGCTASLSTNLSSPAGPTVNVTSATITCFGAANGSAQAVATGVGPFTFTWSPATASVVSGNTTTATGLGAGVYNINVRDNTTGCITSATVNVTQPSASTITSNVFNLSCNSVCNGSITATVSGGTPNYTLNWLPVGSGTLITGLCVGNYTVNVTDANGCASTKTFVVTQPNSLTVTATQTNVLCNAAANGAISVTVAGGSPAYSYTWTPVGTFTGSSNSSINNLPPNVYTLTVSDNNGCPIVQTYTITQPTALGHTVTNTNNTCNSSCNGTASQTVSGGTPTYSFSWSSSAATTATLGALCAGNYTATVVDGNGCVSNQTFTITQPAAISVTATPTSPNCNGACNGSITTNVVGGNPGYSYNWSPAGVGSNPTGLCPNVYTLTVTDASLCIGNAIVTLTNPPAVIANVSFTNPSCNALCNGIAISNPLNATAPVSYTWTNVPPSSVSTATGLCANTIYSVFVSDFKGCTDAQTISLVSPPSLTINPSITPATCGSSNGSISIGISGGTPTYGVLWLPSAATTTFVTNLAAGIYTVTVTDQNGCANTASIPLSNSNGPSSALITSTNVNCNAQCTGAASVSNIVGGTPGYTISWVNPVSASTLVTNLCAGTYTAQVLDANGCLLFQSVSITQPTPFNDNETISNAICTGVCTGSIVLAPTGGTGPYTYTWSSSPSTTTTATGLCTGVQTATITDNNNCVFVGTYTINGTIVLTSALATTSNNCFGNCNGSSTVVASGGGFAPYTFTWSNSQVGPVTNNLCNGTYSVNVTDNSGCQNTFTTVVTSPNAIAVLPSITSPSCGLCNGSSTVTTSGGTSPYTFSWTTGGTAASESSLCAGLYQVLVTDNNGCTQLQNIPISNSSGITGETFNIQNELCFNDCSGSITVTAIGGNAPISYNWISPVISNSVLTNLCAGTYFVQMTDAQGCVRTSSASINSATIINITPTIIPPSCGGGSNDGTVTVNVTGGSGVYTYSWLPAGSTASLNGIGAGVYTLSVNDGNCTRTTVVTVNTGTAPVLFSSITDNGCPNNPCIGSVVVTPTLGTPGYSFNWSNGNTTNSVTGLCQGVITLTVTDAAGCQASQSFSIDQNPALNLSLPFVSQVNCNGDCNGAIGLVPSGGALPYTITWVPATTVTPSNPLTNLCAGTYSGIVTDANGCVITSSVVIADPLPFSLTALVTEATCNSANDGAATTTVSGATPNYTFAWSGPASYSTQNISNVTPGTYSLSIIDSKGCQKDTVIEIAPSFTVLANAGSDATLCLNSSVLLDGLPSINAIGYQWSLVAPPSSSIANTATTLVTPAVGSNTYVLLVTSSIAACFDEDTVIVNINPLPIVDAGPTQSVSLYSPVNIGGNPTSLTGVTYTWLPSNFLNDPNVANPVGNNTVNVTYTVFVTDANGCISSSTVDIFIYPEIKIPNGFSPNADGRNDAWIIDNIQQFTECTVEVYNRWGELLFQSPPGYPTPFDGRFKNKDLPVGTYYYIIDLKHIAYPKPFTGPLTIFR